MKKRSRTRQRGRKNDDTLMYRLSKQKHRSRGRRPKGASSMSASRLFNSLSLGALTAMMRKAKA